MAEAAMQGANCLSGAIWGSVFCSRILWHAAGGAGDLNHLIAGRPTLSPELQLPHILSVCSSDVCVCLHTEWGSEVWSQVVNQDAQRWVPGVNWCTSSYPLVIWSFRMHVMQVWTAFAFDNLWTTIVRPRLRCLMSVGRGNVNFNKELSRNLCATCLS